jgi:glucan phosphorylase
VEIQTKGTVCIYITCNKDTGVYTTHFISKEGNEQFYANALMEKFPSDWYGQIKPLVNQLLGSKVEQLEIKAELNSYIDQAKLVLEHDVLWGLV